jgi:hypothetical protein
MEMERYMWYGVTAMVCVLSMTIGACEMYQSGLIAEMVKAGADPARARCAFAHEPRQNPACLK